MKSNIKFCILGATFARLVGKIQHLRDSPKTDNLIAALSTIFLFNSKDYEFEFSVSPYF